MHVLTSIRHVRPYLPLAPSHAASASIDCTTASARRRQQPCPGVDSDSGWPRDAHRKARGASSQAQSSSAVTRGCERVGPRACEPHCCGPCRARWDAQQAGVSAARFIADTYPARPPARPPAWPPARPPALEAGPSARDVPRAPVKVLTPDSVPFLWKAFHRPHPAAEGCPGEGPPSVLADRKTLSSRLEPGRQLPVPEGAGCLKSDRSHRAVRTSLSLAWQSPPVDLHPVDGHQGCPTPGPVLSRACSSPEVTPTTSDWAELAGHAHSGPSADRSSAQDGSMDPTADASKQVHGGSAKRKRSENEALSVKQSSPTGECLLGGGDGDSGSDDDDGGGPPCCVEDEVCLGMDIPMTNLGLTSTDMLLLF